MSTTGMGGTAQSKFTTLYGKGAIIKGLGGGKFEISYLDLENSDGTKTKVTFPGTNDSVRVFDRSELPLKLADNFNRIMVVISTASDEGLKVTHFQPWEGQVRAKFKGYARPGGKEAMPAPFEGKHKQGMNQKTGAKYDYVTLKFRPYWEVTYPAIFKGQVLVQFLEYSKTDFMKKDANGNPKISPMFVRDDEGFIKFGFGLTANNTALAYPSPRRQEVFDHLRFTGILDMPAEMFKMPEDGNPLPLFEQLAIQQADTHEVLLTIEKGMIADVQPFVDYSEDGLLEEVPSNQPQTAAPTSEPVEISDMDE